jgi:hypothetical protein
MWIRERVDLLAHKTNESRNSGLNSGFYNGFYNGKSEQHRLDKSSSCSESLVLRG